MPGIGIGVGVWRSGGRGSSASIAKRIGTRLGAAAAWDAGVGTLSGASIVSLTDLLGGGHHLAQGGALTLCPTLISDAKGYGASFDGGDFLVRDALAALFSGTSKPFWVLAAIDGVTRTAVAGNLLSFASNAAVHYVQAQPDGSVANQSLARRVDDGGTEPNVVATTTGRTSGAFWVRYDGVNCTLAWGGTTSAAVAWAGELLSSLFTVGARRYGAVPTVGQYLVGILRCMIVGTTVAEADLITAAAQLTAKYGY